MTQVAYALDLLGRQAWTGRISTAGIPDITAMSTLLPSAMLPLRRSEVFQPDTNLENHRRGRGLAWPPEAQTPVLRKPANGIGRLPMAAVLELLVHQERSWGRLEQDHVSWSPDGRERVTVELRRLLGQSVLRHVPELRAQRDATLGFVVPPLLQPAGQQVLVDACQDKGASAFLVPSTMAAAVAWGRTAAAGPYLQRASDGEGTLVGHLLVIDAGLGPWVAVRVPIVALRWNDAAWIVPLRLPRRRHAVVRGPTGWQLLTAIASNTGPDWLSRLCQGSWLANVLSGAIDLPRDALGGVTQPDASGVASLCGLEAGRSGSFYELLAAIPGAFVDRFATDLGPRIGCLVVGALSDMCVAGKSMRSLVAKQMDDQCSPLAATALATGAAIAAHGCSQQPPWPTWRETLDPIDIYYIGKDQAGDPSSQWKSLITSRTVAAGSDYCNESPIRGLALERGASRVRMVLRRPRDDDPNAYEYREVHTRTVADFKAESRVPLEVRVRARAGQGLAVVHVTARPEDQFATTLDWLSMSATGEPDPPKLGYIPKSVKVRSEASLYASAVPDIRALNACIRDTLALATIRRADLNNLDIKALAAFRSIKRTITATYWHRKHKIAALDDKYLFYAALSRDGSVHPACDAQPVTDVVEVAGTLLDKMARVYSETARLRRFCAYLYWACPTSVCASAVRRADLALRRQDITVDPADLQVLGLTSRSPHEYMAAYRLIAAVLPGSTSANDYLRTLRDITRLNDDALSEDALPQDTCAALTATLINYFEWAAGQRKKNVVANCVEALLYMLKRRRYDPTYLDSTSDLRFQLDVAVAKIQGQNTGDAKPWLYRRCITMLDILQRFLQYEATEEEAGNIVSNPTDEDETGAAGDQARPGSSP